MQMTAKRFGSVIDVSGDEVFRSRCVKAAADAGLWVTFKDAKMEAERQAAVKAKRVYLEVPLREKDAAKAAGARWDAEEKKWYVPASQKGSPQIAKWLPAAPETPAHGGKKDKGKGKDKGISL